jgi:methylated-DNA-[protein]-cysteine S-methyltransferase
MTDDRSWDLIELHAAAGTGSGIAGGTPLAVVATAAGGALVALSLFGSPAAAGAAAPADAAYRPDQPPLPEVRRQLAEYFAGMQRDFVLPLEPQGTAFERGVWRALVAIPYGETRSYAEVAMTIGRPSACRAVGRANGRNPIAVVIPCHRVIGSDGSLTGYGGGLELKRLLLDLEGAGRGAQAPATQPALPL